MFSYTEQVKTCISCFLLLQNTILADSQIELSGFFQIVQQLRLEILWRKSFATQAAIVLMLFPRVLLLRTLRCIVALEATCTTAESPLLLPLHQAVERKCLQRFLGVLSRRR